MNRFGFGSVRVISGHSGSVRFGSFRVIFGSGLDRINKISGRFDFGLGHFGFGLIRVNTTSGRFGSGSVQFWFRIEFGSDLSDVGSGLVSGRSVRFIRFGSVLPGLVLWREKMEWY